MPLDNIGYDRSPLAGEISPIIVSRPAARWMVKDDAGKLMAVSKLEGNAGDSRPRTRLVDEAGRVRTVKVRFAHAQAAMAIAHANGSNELDLSRRGLTRPEIQAEVHRKACVFPTGSGKPRSSALHRPLP